MKVSVKRKILFNSSHSSNRTGWFMLNFLLKKVSLGITGFESAAATYSQLPLSLQELLIDAPSSTSISMMEDGSLRKMGIFPGDLLIVNRSLTPQKGDVVLCYLNGDIICRLLDMERKSLFKVELAPDRTIETPIQDTDDFTVMGVVPYSIRVHVKNDNRFRDFTLNGLTVADAQFNLDELLNINPQATFFAQASGNSMQGSGIFNNDLIIVDRALEVTNEAVIVCNYNSEFACKIIDTINQTLLSTSCEHEPKPIREIDTFNVEGVVPVSIRILRPLPQLI